MSAITLNGGSADKDSANRPAARLAATFKYPARLAARNFIEQWMLVAAAVAFAAALAVSYARPLPLAVLLATPAVTLALAAALRAKTNVRRLRHRRREYVGKLQREARYGALARSARQAVDELRAVKASILDKITLRGQALAPMLARLDEYELDFIDLLFLFQERARSLQALKARDTAGARQALEADRARLRGGGGEPDELAKRTLGALEHRAELLNRQDAVARDLEGSLDLIMQQARNIQEFFSLVSSQVSSLPLDVALTSNALDFEALSDTIQMTKETLNSVGENY